MIAYNRSLLVLTVTLLLLIGYQFIDAAWTPATGTPPNNNTAAPLNVSATTQAKSGNLQANIFAATTEMRSNRYCDALGGNCFVLPLDMSGSDHTDADCIAQSGTPVQVGDKRICRLNLNTCPLGWQQFDNWSTTVAGNCGGGCSQSCSTGSHTFGNVDSAREFCTYRPGHESQGECDFGAYQICRSTITQIGCY